MKTFSENLRYEYDLKPDSVVLDCGAYEGNFSKQIYERYKCHVIAFEPISRFYKITSENLEKYPITLFHAAVGGNSRTETFHIQNDSTGKFAGSPITEQCQVMGIQDVMKLPVCNGVIDLIKLNVEGMEFEILESLIREGGSGFIKNIQVQFHSVVEYGQSRYDVISAALSYTHRLTYRAPWCWENWELK